MKSLREQISDKCIHFNGVMNEYCKAGIRYDDIRVGRPFKFPCLKQGGECSQSSFLTEEEVNKEIIEIEGMSNKVITAYIKIKEHYQKTMDNPGKLPCECGGELKYTVAESNGHIWAKCSSCGIYFNE